MYFYGFGWHKRAVIVVAAGRQPVRRQKFVAKKAQVDFRSVGVDGTHLVCSTTGFGSSLVWRGGFWDM